MGRKFGIVYNLDLDWIEEFIGTVELDDWDSDIIFEDGIFYQYNEDVKDEQESDWVKVEDIYLIEKLTNQLLRDKKVVDEFYKYIETELTRKLKENYLINLIEEI